MVKKLMQKRGAARMLAGAVLGLALTAPAWAGPMDFLFGRALPVDVAAGSGKAKRLWRISEFSAVRLVPREEGAEPNDQPLRIQPEVLRQQLTLVRTTVGARPEALFAADEISELIEPLSQALAAAGPGDDVLLLSSSRRGDSFLSPARSVTARLFARGEQLNLIVHDTRLEFTSAWLGSKVPPELTFGARSAASMAQVQSDSGKVRRADWLTLPMVAMAAVQAPVPIQTPAAATERARDPAFYQDMEQRLKALKRLREQGLLTEEEFQQKRRDIVQAL